MEDKIAILAGGRIEDEFERSVSRHGFNDVPEMIFNLSLGHADDFGDASRRKWSAAQEILDALSWRAFIGNHTSTL
jgi:hypothetical protein